MNTNSIKKYAPKARTAFIEAISQRAAHFGISPNHIEPVQRSGEVLTICQATFPVSIAQQRDRLEQRVRRDGFEQTIEHIAYSWFNRFCAIRFMELKGFLSHGRKVLSAIDGSDGMPQILEECLDLQLEGLDQAQVRQLKLANEDEALYRELLLAQCHELHKAMPFLFEAIADETELLLPNNLTKTDSLLRDLVREIPQEDWADIEIMGWLYQFYISEKKDQVIGKVVKSEDIPAATQLFTPNWIVQYLVQNSIGRQWLQTYPESPLKAAMPYYIEPAEQTPEVQAQLAAITPSSIEPESIKVLDPACGSGHILVEAYKVLKAIYEERGYRTRDIPELILKHNLYGLDIDDRAGQLAAFTLMMLAREDDRRIFDRDIQLNVIALQDTKGLELPLLWQQLNFSGDWQQGHTQDLIGSPESQALYQADDRYQLLERTLEKFQDAKTFGSLIDIPQQDEQALQVMFETLKTLQKGGDENQVNAAHQLLPIIRQALLLAQKYDAVVANPPYMGGKYQSPAVKKDLKSRFSGYEKDLFSAFIIRNLQLTKEHGQLGFMTPFVWMFISSYEQLRAKLIDDEIISTLVQLEYSGFDGATVPICTFTLTKGHIKEYTGSYIRLSDFKGAVNQGPKTLEAIQDKACGWFYTAKPDDFKKIPGSPIAYWVGESFREIYNLSFLLGDKAHSLQGMITGDNNKFLRKWFEVSFKKLSLYKNSISEVDILMSPWIPYNKGGEVRKWYGNNEDILNWSNEGKDLVRSRTKNSSYYFKPCITWTFISSAFFASRYCDNGFVWDVAGSSAFPYNEQDFNIILSFMASPVGKKIIDVSNPTLNYQVENVLALPLHKELFAESIRTKLINNTQELIELAKFDWDIKERSWDFKKSAFIAFINKTLKSTYAKICKEFRDLVKQVHDLENKNLEIINKVYGLDEQKVKLEHITLSVNKTFNYNDEENRFNSDQFIDLVSYTIGCMMGRYSLDQEGLVYAHSDNKGFSDLVDQGAYKTFPADDDGIIPLTQIEWFPDDATNRFKEFVEVVWGKDHLQENLDFVAESLCLHAIKPKKTEAAIETIRRYFSEQFFKDHLKTYKKRPIYWLFSSGKTKAFECLVYLHRYNESTLSRMRTAYVIPLLTKMDAYAEKLAQDRDASESAAEIKRLEKELAQLQKQQAELSSFDEKLRHYAHQRISLDLDDGVKVNYGKFGDLLANVKDVTGSHPEKLKG